MERLIQPLSDILKNHPDDSAKFIVFLSIIFTTLSGIYIALKEQQLNLEKKRTELSKDEKKRLEDQDQKIRQMVDSERKILDELKTVKQEFDKLEKEKLSLEVNLKVAKGQETLHQIIEATQNNIRDIEGAILTKKDRSNAVDEIIEKQARRRKKAPLTSIFSLFKRKN